MGKNDIIIILAAAAAAAYALPKIVGNKIDEAAKTDRTEVRKDAAVEKVSIRQEEKTERTQARWEGISNIFQSKTKSKPSNNSTVSVERNVEVVQAKPIVTTKSKPSPFIPSASGAANTTLASGRSAYTPAPTISKITTTTTKSKPTTFQKIGTKLRSIFNR